MTEANEQVSSPSPTKEKKEEFSLDEIAWKKVKGEVFKKPKCAMLFSILIGTGIQIFFMAVFAMIFAFLGFI